MIRRRDDEEEEQSALNWGDAGEGVFLPRSKDGKSIAIDCGENVNKGCDECEDQQGRCRRLTFRFLDLMIIFAAHCMIVDAAPG